MSNIFIHTQNFKTMRKFLTLFLLVSSFAGFSQKSNDKKLAAAIQAFQDATEITGMMESVQMFKEVSDKDKGWIPAYWTSFAFSQIGRLSENPPAYYDSAQLYLDKVVSNKALSDIEKSDVHALQSLIYGLRAGSFWAKGDRENGLKYSNLDSESLAKAIEQNGNNPRVYLLSGTSIISDGLRNQDAGYLLAGKHMLEMAKAKYEASESSNELYPNWGKGWINFWLGRAKLSSD